MIKDIVEARNKVVKNLDDHGFKPRDADPTDFQFADDNSLRFKVGTSYSEVTVTVWYVNKSRFQAKRATSDAQIIELNHWVDSHVADFFSPDKRKKEKK